MMTSGKWPMMAISRGYSNPSLHLCPPTLSFVPRPHHFFLPLPHHTHTHRRSQYPPPQYINFTKKKKKKGFVHALPLSRVQPNSTTQLNVVFRFRSTSRPLLLRLDFYSNRTNSKTPLQKKFKKMKDRTKNTQSCTRITNWSTHSTSSPARSR